MALRPQQGDARPDNSEQGTEHGEQSPNCGRKKGARGGTRAWGLSVEESGCFTLGEGEKPGEQDASDRFQALIPKHLTLSSLENWMTGEKGLLKHRHGACTIERSWKDGVQ